MSVVDESKEISIWLSQRLDGLEVASDERTRTAAGCFETTLEHQVAIGILFENRLYGPSNTKLQSEFSSRTGFMDPLSLWLDQYLNPTSAEFGLNIARLMKK